MRKLLLTCFLFGYAVAAMAQQKTIINVTKSDNTVYTKFNGADVARVYRGTFVQQYSTLTADSSIIYMATNVVDAIGHVVINQGDTLHIYADKLHYDDKTKIAVLTDHVRMVDKDAVLTTNYLTYNTATKVGTYVDGGKLVSKDNVLTSKNGYYYAGTRDVYFRYNVVTTSPDALIKTDTMRYNSGTRITYFYGPTHIYGKKDKDTLYTENGTYNTKTEQAFFGKKNRYSQGTKSLKGDSLFYDKLKGYGKAIKNITFEDTEQKMLLKGNLGEYFKGDDKAVITQNPYVIFITEEKDTTKITTPPNPLRKPTEGLLKDSTAIGDLSGMVKGLPTTVPTGMPSLNAKTLAKADSIAKVNAKNPLLKIGADSLAKVIANQPAVKNTMPLITGKMQDSVKKAAAAMGIPIPATVKTKPVVKPAIKPIVKTVVAPKVDSTLLAAKMLAKKDSAAHIKRDTMFIGADTLETQIVTYKVLKELQEQRRLSGIRDTSLIPRRTFVPYTAKTVPKYLEAVNPKMITEKPSYIDRPLFDVVKPKPDSTHKAVPDSVLKSVDVKKPATDAKGKPIAGKAELKSDTKTGNSKSPLPRGGLGGATDSLKIKLMADSLKMPKPLSDTSRVRILSAHHNVHIFKSDLQGKADSLFYSSSDSVIRSFVKPMYWTQGAQLSGDTIYLQLKNKKADNMTVFPKAFIVYIEKGDSTHFNQLGGKHLKGWFKDSKISHVFVSGNAETIYFNRNDKTKKITEMARSESSTIAMNFKKGEMINVSFANQSTNNVLPIAKVKEDDKILKNFIWKPKERPASKQDVINPKKPAPEPEAPKKGATGSKPSVRSISTTKGDAKPAVKDSVNKTTPVKIPVIKPAKHDPANDAATDSMRRFPGILPAVKKDTLVKKP